MSSKFNCSYMAMSSLKIYSGFFCEIFLSVDLYRLYKLGIFWWKITFKSFPLKPLNQIKPSLARMVLGWVPFPIMSDSSTLHSKWLLLLKISALLQIKMNSNFNCSYMAMSSLTYILGFSVRFFQPVYSI